MKEDAKSFRIIEVLDRKGRPPRRYLANPLIDDLPLDDRAVSVYEELAKGTPGERIDEIFLERFGEIGTGVRRSIEEHTRSPRLQGWKYYKEPPRPTAAWTGLSSATFLVAAHLAAFVLLFTATHSLSSLGRGLFSAGPISIALLAACVPIAGFLPFLVQALAYQAAVGTRPGLGLAMRCGYISLSPEMTRLHRLPMRAQALMVWMPLGVLMVLAACGQVIALGASGYDAAAGRLVASAGAALAVAAWARWFIEILPLQGSLLLRGLALRGGHQDMLEMWKNLYAKALPLAKKTATPLSKSVERHLLYSSLYALACVLLVTLLIRELWLHRASVQAWASSGEFLPRASLLAFRVFLAATAVFAGLVVLKMWQCVRELLMSWIVGARMSAFLTVFGLLLLFGLPPLLLPDAVHPWIFTAVTAAGLVVHYSIRSAKASRPVESSLLMLALLAALAWTARPETTAAIAMIAACYLFMGVCHPAQFLIASCPCELRWPALGSCLSALLAAGSLLLALLGMGQGGAVLLCASASAQLAASLVRINPASSSEEAWEKAALWLKSHGMAECESDQLRYSCEVLLHKLIPLFGRPFSALLLRRAFLLPRSGAAGATEAYFESRLNRMLSYGEESRLHGILHGALSPWLPEECLREILAFPADQLPWSHRLFLRVFLEGGQRYPESMLSLKDAAQAVSSSFLFSHFPKEQQRRIAEAMLPEPFGKGSTIVRQGDNGDRLYLIFSGHLCVTQQDQWGSEEELIKLKERDFFGELSLLRHQPRSATVRAENDGMLLSMSSFSFAGFAAGNMDRIRTLSTAIDDLWFIRTTPLFENFPGDSLYPFISAFSHRSCKAGEHVFKEGDAGTEFFIIRQGSARVIKGGRCLARLGVCDYFGEIALLRNIPRTAGIEAESNMELLVLPGKSFQTIVQANPALLTKLEHANVKRLTEQRR